MPDLLRDQLEATLGTAYTLGRELGGGGMSRVFVAHETALGRDIVVKVLPPELAEGLSVERFAREIRVSAALQDPHIVPVLAAGATADGVPWYTMPLVRGESLRGRMERGPLPVAEAVGVLRNVAQALHAAHAHGVVHRDIKPENVLLSGDTAVVTDFGIATALGESGVGARDPGRRAAAGASGGPGPAARAEHRVALTVAGASLGTPAYMAPEQILGEPVDGRADLYAWGIMAHELLAGRHPFAARTTPQQLVAAHLGEAPASLAGRRPAFAAPLVDVVARCVAKTPAERPASAAEVIACLDRASAAPAAGRAGRRVAAGLGVVLPIALGAGWLAAPADTRAALRTVTARPRARLVVNRVVVAPFHDDTGDPTLASLGGLVADHLTEELARLGTIQVVDTRMATIGAKVVSRIPRFLRPGDDRALGEETGARVVVAGRYYVDGDTVRFAARVLDAASGEVHRALPVVSASARAPGAGVAALARRVVAALRSSSDTLAVDMGVAGAAAPASLEAFEALRQGFDRYMGERDPGQAMSFLRRAVALDTAWSTAAVALAWVASDLGHYADADSALARAARLVPRPTPDEQAFLDAVEARARGDVAGVLAAAQRAPMPIDLVTAMAAVQARRPALVLQVLQRSDPDRGVNLARSLLYWQRVFHAHVQRGDRARASAAAAELLRRFPSRADDLPDVIAAAARGDAAAVARVDGRQPDAPAPRRTKAIAGATTLLRMRGRDADGLGIARRWAARAWPAGAPVPAVVRPGFLGLGDLMILAERWDDALRATDAEEAWLRGTAVPQGVVTPGEAIMADRRLRARRAVALIHLGRRREAAAIDAALAPAAGARWDMGLTALARAEIAAHLGDTDRALALLAGAVQAGALVGLETFLYPLPTVDADPLLLPLRDDARFRALAGPDE